MNYHNITHDDMLNGEGLRVVLWVAGCYHHCPECQNPETWDPDSGVLFDKDAEKEIFDELKKPHVSGLTLSGGDPLFMFNRDKVTKLCEKVKYKFPDKTIWLYTGYKFEDIRDLSILNYIDVLVDGRYEKDEKDIDLEWKGSKNQRIIDVRKSRFFHKVILYQD